MDILSKAIRFASEIVTSIVLATVGIAILAVSGLILFSPFIAWHFICKFW